MREEFSPLSLCLSSAEVDPGLIRTEHTYGWREGCRLICELVELFPPQMFFLTSSELTHL